MDTSTGKVYKDIETALKDGAKRENLIEFNALTLEGNQTLMGVLRFLLRDDAFNNEFLITTILEYIEKIAKEQKE